uniref:Uncharacterized protein n=1 Tax=Timema cristinae TaxID=61476 RepID=A0A7R9D7W0_TIMCR|nr:unnamed protein product [Timema cristinae]
MMSRAPIRSVGRGRDRAVPAPIQDDPTCSGEETGFVTLRVLTYQNKGHRHYEEPVHYQTNENNTHCCHKTTERVLVSGGSSVQFSVVRDRRKRGSCDVKHQVRMLDQYCPRVEYSLFTPPCGLVRMLDQYCPRVEYSLSTPPCGLVRMLDQYCPRVEYSLSIPS